MVSHCTVKRHWMWPLVKHDGSDILQMGNKRWGTRLESWWKVYPRQGGHSFWRLNSVRTLRTGLLDCDGSFEDNIAAIGGINEGKAFDEHFGSRCLSVSTGGFNRSDLFEKGLCCQKLVGQQRSLLVRRKQKLVHRKGTIKENSPLGLMKALTVTLL